MPSIALTTSLRGQLTGTFSFQPSSLFLSGQQGVWYDIADRSTLFQDSAGTIPVTAFGQPVGLILDKSGRGNHARQTTSGSRPLYQADANGKVHLNFDGVDDFMLLNTALNMGTGTFVTGFVETAGQTGPVALFANNGPGYVAINGAFTTRSLAKNNSGLTAQIDTPGVFPMTAQSPVQINVSGVTLTAYRGSDRTAYTNSLAGAATLSFQAIGAFSALGEIRVNGRFYGLVARTVALTESEALDTLSYFSTRV